jgi:hypothetical protein
MLRVILPNARQLGPRTTRPISEDKAARMLRQLGPYYCFIILFNIYMCIILYLFKRQLLSFSGPSCPAFSELYFILASTCFSPLAILASVWKKWFPTLYALIITLNTKINKKLDFQIYKWLWLRKEQ